MPTDANSAAKYAEEALEYKVSLPWITLAAQQIQVIPFPSLPEGVMLMRQLR